MLAVHACSAALLPHPCTALVGFVAQLSQACPPATVVATDNNSEKMRRLTHASTPSEPAFIHALVKAGKSVPSTNSKSVGVRGRLLSSVRFSSGNIQSA